MHTEYLLDTMPTLLKADVIERKMANGIKSDKIKTGLYPTHWLWVRLTEQEVYVAHSDESKRYKKDSEGNKDRYTEGTWLYLSCTLKTKEESFGHNKWAFWL